MSTLVRRNQAHANGEISANAPSHRGAYGFDFFDGLEVARTDESYVIMMPVPGFNSSNITVTLEDDVIVVKAEAPHHRFSRACCIPSNVDTAKISAMVLDGVLELLFPRKPPTIRRNIAVL